ncbi:MAG: EAL domain-containing protein [Coriobacteriia bacterium]|nr:EAL domain-containing protein [Coriobacteriia bacterium]
MLKAHEKFHSANGKRLVLIVDDEAINRELLGIVLKDNYETVFAADGEEALQVIRENSETLSLILLDLLMPGMHGLDLLKILKNDQQLKDIPIIVLTSDQEAEVTSLQLGAADFIPKPYPKPEVILTRAARSIELSEDRDIIMSTERDALTGLYNREYFYRYAEQFDQHHRGTDMDAIVVDVRHFRMINERYGKAYGDEVLRRIGEKLREMVRDSGGIVCRREADTFLVYCPHREDYKSIIDNASVGAGGTDASENRVRLRMGVYAHVDKGIEMERRFDRAKMAADTVRNTFIRNVGYYDNELHESEIYTEQLLEDFQEALDQKQFQVFFQPKFDIRPEIPVLSSAEALVRWQHPEFGLISPGIFIPLFEENGLIQQIDLYVWRHTAAQIRDWKERLGVSVPVSVNVSRIDMYDPKLVEMLEDILKEFELDPSELLLEITESAYTQDSAQIISTVNKLREIGFRIEMDDFGTGYSSLSMISSLPIDALKLDMTFIREAFRDGRDTRLIEVIIDIADYLGVPVIAEGVETEEQLRALKAMGCDIVQGYYFSRPIPSVEYEAFVEQKAKQLAEETAAVTASVKEIGSERAVTSNIAHALTSGFEVIYYVDANTGYYVEFSARGRYEDLQIERSGDDFFGDTQRNIPRVVHEEDRERVALSMQKDVLLAQLIGGRAFSMTYRLVIDGKPMYHNLRAVSTRPRDDSHLVIGVSNVEEQIAQADGAVAPQRQGSEFFDIAQALSSDFESIYYVDLATDDYTEFTAPGGYESLHIELSGTDFFAECQKNIPVVVYEDDRQKVADAMRKDAICAAVNRKQSFLLSYRLVIDGAPMYYQMKVVMTDDEGHLVVGVSSVSRQVAREEEALLAQKREGVTYARIVQALSREYFAIYCVNIETNSYVEYSTYGGSGSLTTVREGEDFFDVCQAQVPVRVVPDDRALVSEALDRDAFLYEIENYQRFVVNCQLVVEGRPLYASIRALNLKDDPTHVIVGVRNADEQARQERELEKTRQDSVTFSTIAQALAGDYFSIYYVDTKTDEFVEFTANDDYEQLGIEKGGDDFFNLSRTNIVRVAHPDDVGKILAAFTKENLLQEMAESGTFTLNYRLMFGDTPNYVSMKATRMAGDDHHIVIGVNNIDAQMRRERELNMAREKANRDALTGVKSKHAYNESCASANASIADGTSMPFAVAVCDVNGLKTVNDTLGHAAGDQLILDATRIICDTFDHSPVFRVGGDEFVAILRGQDYERRDELMAQIEQINREHVDGAGVVIACGISTWVPGEDATIEDVFARADAKMYENKTALKQRG